MWRQKFFDLVKTITADEDGIMSDLDLTADSTSLAFEYDLDESGRKVVLGKGTYGIVYAARDLNTQVL